MLSDASAADDFEYMAKEETAHNFIKYFVLSFKESVHIFVQMSSKLFAADSSITKRVNSLDLKRNNPDTFIVTKFCIFHDCLVFLYRNVNISWPR